MTFKNIEDFKDYIHSKAGQALSNVRDSVYTDFEETIDDFYDWYNPRVYVRTKQLPKTLQKGETYGINNKIYSSVYFDPYVLDYSTRIVPKRFKGANPMNTYHRNSWSIDNDEWVFETAMNYGYVHGGWRGAPKQPPIWWDSLAKISFDINNYFDHHLDFYIGAKKK